VLNNIGCGIFLKQPTRKNITPFFGFGCAGGALLHQQLHKCAFVRSGFPWRGFLASPEPDDHFVKANSFARFEFYVAGLPVSLVQ
jgi:hypothetical protein